MRSSEKPIHPHPTLGRLFDLDKVRYGALRLTLELWEEGWTVSRKRVAKRMRALGLGARTARKHKADKPDGL